MATARLLIVDDEPANLSLLSRILEEKYDIFSATDPLKALEFLKTAPPIDLVLSDIEMPEMRGPDLLREVCRISPATAGVLMSGNEEALSELPAGTRFLRKPFSPYELRTLVELVLKEARELAAALAGEREKSKALIDQARRLRFESREARRETARIRNRLRVTLDLPSVPALPEQGIDTIICSSCAGELLSTVQVCNYCSQPIGLHTIVREGHLYGIAHDGEIRMHGLDLRKAQEITFFLNGIAKD